MFGVLLMAKEVPLPRNGYPGVDTKTYVRLKRLEKFKLLLKDHHPGCNFREYPVPSDSVRSVLSDEVVVLEKLLK